MDSRPSTQASKGRRLLRSAIAEAVASDPAQRAVASIPAPGRRSRTPIWVGLGVVVALTAAAPACAALGAVDVLLSEHQEREKAKNPPVDWASLSEEQAAEQWPVLARWIAEILVPRYQATRNELPDCWALHPPVVAELSWLRTAYVQAYLTRSPPQLAADWHTRWRPAVMTRIQELIKPDQCSPGRHAPQRGTPFDMGLSNGVLPRTQLAEPPCWWPSYDRAYRLDLAIRRARAAAGELNWSPVPARA